MKAKIWKITGYRGWDAYGGTKDNNFSEEVIFDGSLTKDELESFFYDKYRRAGYKTVIVRAENLDEIDLEFGVTDDSDSKVNDEQLWTSIYDRIEEIVKNITLDYEICRNIRELRENCPVATVFVPVRNNRVVIDKLCESHYFVFFRNVNRNNHQYAKFKVFFKKNGEIKKLK